MSSIRLSYNFDIISNQAVNFTYNEVDCKSSENDINYANIVSYNDTTKVQFDLDKLLNEGQLLLNSEFTSNLTGWTTYNMSWVTGGSAQNTSTTDTHAQMYITPNIQYMPFGKNAYMKVVFGVDVNTNGGVLQAGRGRLDLNPNEIGEFTIYGMLTDTAGYNYVNAYFNGASASVSSFNCSLNYIRAYPINYDYIFIIRNTNTNAIEYVYELYNYINQTDYIGADPFRIIDNKLTWTIDWSSLSLQDGCYRLEVLDTSFNTNMQNGMYNQDFNYASEYLDASSSGSVIAGYTGDSCLSVDWTDAGLLTIENPTAIPSGVNYNYEVGITAHSGTNVTLRVGFFTGDDDIHTISTTGVITGDLTSNGTDLFAFSVSKITSGVASLKIDYVRLTLADSDDYESNYISNTFTVSSDTCNSLVLHGCSDVDYAFDLNFLDSDYELRGRVIGRLVNANYDIVKSSYYYGESRNIRTSYYSRKKLKQLVLDLLPEYMLDFITAWIGLDHIYIDNVEYVLDEENFFTLTYDTNLNNAGYVVINLFEKNSTIVHKPNVSLGIGCVDNQDYVIDPDTLEPVIDPVTGAPIISLA